MKRYLTFFGDVYYPDEGMKDFINDFENINDAIEAIKIKSEETIKHKKYKDPWLYNWCQIYDSEKRQICFTELNFHDNKSK